jgi:hypothetical protein
MNSERFQLWTALTSFSFINFISQYDELADAAEDWEREEVWVLSVSAISTMTGFLACLSHLIWKDGFSGSRIEGLFVSTYTLIIVTFMTTSDFIVSFLMGTHAMLPFCTDSDCLWVLVRWTSRLA